MPFHCVAFGCGKTVEDGVTLFKFPKDPDEFRKWEKQVQRTRVEWVATNFSHLCSDHFGKEYFEGKLPSGALKLRPGAAPTVFVRPQCSSCSGVGCRKCLPSTQRCTSGATTTEHSNSGEYKEKEIEDNNSRKECLPRRGMISREKGTDDRPLICEMCGITGSFSTFFSKSKRFCSLSCSRSFSSNSKKSSILARLQEEEDDRAELKSHCYERECVYIFDLNLLAAVHLFLEMFNTCCVDSCNSKRSNVIFHRFPLGDPERLRQWLFTLNMNPNTPVHILNRIFVCQKHFQLDDYQEPPPHPSRRGRLLKATAVPTQLIYGHLSGAGQPTSNRRRVVSSCGQHGTFYT
ncbi:hypothetical protein ILYODFUR_024092 [Ilyodon furcidens]|uniref:THAP domain-containing protein 1 n=1 Tax=Ilyodon furcidens TaxID=33524 RepID=A0ABV0SQ39_9TELE